MLSSNAIKNLHLVALLLLSLPLIGAFGIQIFMHELPCPLCLLQRVGMLGVAVGLLLNLRFGIHPMHYGLSIVSALIGASVSTRQILLHIVPRADGVTGFGDAVLGMHLYTWALVVFLSSILGIALLMILIKREDAPYDLDTDLSIIQKAIFILFITIAFANMVGVFLECGVLPCPDDPQNYMLLSSLKGL
jgi:disulfide bond formation protein DsbB